MTCSNRGFTLIEVMVALTLSGLIAVLLTSGVRMALDSSARGNAKADSIRTSQAEHQILRTQVQGALPFRYWIRAEDKRTEHFAFEGQPDRVRFISREGLLDGAGSFPRWIDIRQERAADDVVKLRIEERRILSPDNEPGETVIASAEALRCKEIRFQYFDPTGEKARWLQSWTEPDRPAPLPFAIRIDCTTLQNPLRFLIPLDYADSARQGMVLQ